MPNTSTASPLFARRRLLFAALSAIALAPFLAGCPANNESEQKPAATGGGTTGTPASGKTIKAGLVTDTGGVNDRSFNQMAYEGLQKAEKEFGASIKVQESKANADYVSNLSRFAQGNYDIVFAVGFKMQDALKEVAPRFPNVKFVIIDGDAPDLPNCASYKFQEEQGSFLVGALAGLMTKTSVIGFVGGEQMPLIQKFEAGYKAGLQTTNPKATVKVGYANSFSDPQKGQELAISQMNAKADIIYHAAGETGVGVIKAVEAKGKGFYAIGVDKDQDGEAKGRVLTSMVKRVDVAVFQATESVSKGAFKPGSTTVGLKEDGIALSPMEFTKQDIPAPIMARIDALKQQIIDGKITPPTTPAELAEFKPPVEK
ncbi:MAG: BMP family ABC transporter substrate-binding protein [Armatimonadetes bacterium]|nr:BMP family ABC transporter substrate-binding protein [Armatimonadota bacterium]